MVSHFEDSHSRELEVFFHWSSMVNIGVLIGISLINDGVFHLLSGHSWVFLCKMTVQVFAHCFIGLLVFVAFIVWMVLLIFKF